MAETFWTQADIDKLKFAVTAGVLTINYDGPPKRQVTYQSLGEMRALLSEMRREVAGSPAFRRASFSKGFTPPAGSTGSTGSNGGGDDGGGNVDG